MTVGKKIKNLRLEHKLKKTQLANILLVNRTSIDNWENDLTEPHLYALIGMADIFGVTLDELCCHTPKERKEK